MEPSTYWRLCAELTINQAALLIVGVDPSEEMGSQCESWKIHERPKGYEAVKSSISVAMRHGKASGNLIPFFEYDINGNQCGEVAGSVNTAASMVDVESLKAWMRSCGIETGFFFPGEAGVPGYLDPDHSRYSGKLAAAVSAWQAVTDPVGKSPKQALEKWLREHATEFGLTDDDGNPVAQAMEECSKVANWQPGGGASKTPG